MIYRNDNNNINNKDINIINYHNYKEINLNYQDNNNNIIDYIANNSQKLINNNLTKFIEDKSYKNIDNKIIKNKILYFSSFINSCKIYTNISELKEDLRTVLKQKIDNVDYYYNIINNYINNIYDLISDKQFFEVEKNVRKLFKIFKKIDKYLYIAQTGFYEIKNEIMNTEIKILNLLQKYNNKQEIDACIKILNKNINKLNGNINGKNKFDLNESKERYINTNKNGNIVTEEKNLEESNIIIDFDSYKRVNPNIYFINKNNSYKDNKINYENNISSIESLNNAKFIEKESLDYLNNTKSNNYINIKKNNIYNSKTNDIPIQTNNIKKNKNKKEKEKKYIQNKEDNNINNNIESYNYENLMCPPIKSDESQSD